LLLFIIKTTQSFISGEFSMSEKLGSELDPKQLASELVGELVKALGFAKNGLMKQLSKPFVWKPIFKFTRLALQFEEIVIQQGFQKAAAWFISNFVERVEVHGQESLPGTGPLIVASNHPGAYDSLIISASIPRSDLKIISSPIPFLQKFPFSSNHLIFSDRDPHTRMGVVRKGIRHLEQGGALLVFARGTIDPDPAFMAGTEDEIPHWSSSLGLFLRKVPQTKMAISMVSGILIPSFVQHPLTALRENRVDKQRISEFFQIIRQLINPESLKVSPHLTFSSPISLLELGQEKTLKELSELIVSRALEEFDFHLRMIASAAPGMSA
jgi:hypothetical protein